MTPENQTLPQWIEKYSRQDEGTGVFLTHDASGAPSIRFARDVRYLRCLRIAETEGFSAFKWVPRSIATAATVEDSRCAIEGQPCRKTCKGLCCICDPTTRVCVSKIVGGDGGKLKDLTKGERSMEGTRPMPVAG